MNNVEIITQNDVVVMGNGNTTWAKCALTGKDADCLALLIDGKEWLINRSDAVDVVSGDFPKLERMSETVLESMYDEMLDDVFGEIDICGLKYDASVALAKIDRVAYRTEYYNWLDAMIDDGKFIELNDEIYKAI